MSHEVTHPETVRTSVQSSRAIERIVKGMATSDGAGVKLTRLLTSSLQRRLDPFLMLDNFASDNPDDYIGGFPDHPHRGFETITCMIEGRMRHRDSAGNEGLLESGGVQWMTAGRGVIHSELPEQLDGRMEGFQFWLNLPADRKMCTPWYRDMTDADIPRLSLGGAGLVRVIAGQAHGVAGSIQREITEPLLLDVHLTAGGEFAQPLPAGHNAFVAVYRGSISVAGQSVPAGSMALLKNDASADGVVLQAAEGARFMLAAGKPLNQPIAQYGPFVMNTQAELVQAVEDFRAGLFAAA